jgi:RimJ/RimL family protein N-acetyltransferase
MSDPTTTAATASTTTTFEVRVTGHLDDHWATWLDQSTLARQDDGTTVLTGSLADQSQLHGVLARIRDLGVPLVSLSPFGAPAPEAPVAPSAPTLSRPLFTDRLTLRPAGEGDAEATWRYRRLPSVGQWLTELPTDLETYRTSFTDPQRLSATVMVECDGHAIGDLMLRVEDAWAQAEVSGDGRAAQAELGWVLDPAHSGHGLATEAVRALLTYCFADRGVRRVAANCFLGNERSWRLMERLGMRREGHAVAESRHRSGQWLDTVSYAMLAAEWSP